MRYSLFFCITTKFLMISMFTIPVRSLLVSTPPTRTYFGKISWNTMRTTSHTIRRHYNVHSLFGGDYGGLSGTFHSKTGKLVPVPEHYVPPSMLEWGQIPTALEVITSEQQESDEKELQRWTVSVMPEVGCGVDNLDTMKKEERWTNSGNGDWTAIFLEQDAPSSLLNKKRIEVCFPLQSHDQDGLPCRIRVGFDIMETKDDNNLYELGSLITIISERKNKDEHTGGTIADGGGLDARTVYKLVGNENINKPFTEQTPQISDNILNGMWSKSNELNLEYWNDPDYITLYLPGNTLVRYCFKSLGDVVDGNETEHPFLDLQISVFENLQNENGSLRLKRTCWKGNYSKGLFSNLDSWEEYKVDK